jgi:hypothetical protein
MKKIILTVAAVFALSFANAQDKKETTGGGFGQGDIYLTGNVGFSSEKTGDVKDDSFELRPGVGYFLTENLALVGELRYKSQTENSGAPLADDFKTTTIGLAVGVDYFWTPASQFSLSLGGRLGYASVKEDNGVATATGKEISFNVPLGLHYFVSDDFALTTTWGGLSYTTNDNGGDGAEKTNTIDLNLGLSSVTFGLLYKL